MAGVISANLIRAIGQPARVAVALGKQQQARRFDGVAGEHDRVGILAVECAFGVCVDDSGNMAARIMLKRVELTADELEQMKELVRDGYRAGALYSPS